MGGGKMDISTKVSSGRITPVKAALYALIAVVLIVSPLLFEGFGLLFLTRIMALVGLYVMLALGLNIVVGFAGLLDLGYIAFYAIGAYSGVIVGAQAMKAMPSQWAATSSRLSSHSPLIARPWPRLSRRDRRAQPSRSVG